MPSITSDITEIAHLANKRSSITVEDARSLIKLVSRVFREHLKNADVSGRQITRITTKFRDAGRRSPPWQPHSNVTPGRPQDGEDGNRRSRWLFETEHKFYADEITATLVEVRYYLQALSMKDAPPLPSNAIEMAFNWLIEHPVRPNEYLDPIQLIPISLNSFIEEPRSIQSGHIVPLDRGGRHEPPNAFLVLARSNQLQGNLTVEELVELMDQIVERHRLNRSRLQN